jgi:hypothetical protein
MALELNIFWVCDSVKVLRKIKFQGGGDFGQRRLIFDREQNVFGWGDWLAELLTNLGGAKLDAGSWHVETESGVSKLSVRLLVKRFEDIATPEVVFHLGWCLLFFGCVCGVTDSHLGW